MGEVKSAHCGFVSLLSSPPTPSFSLLTLLPPLPPLHFPLLSLSQPYTPHSRPLSPSPPTPSTLPNPEGLAPGNSEEKNNGRLGDIVICTKSGSVLPIP